MIVLGLYWDLVTALDVVHCSCKLIQDIVARHHVDGCEIGVVLIPIGERVCTNQLKVGSISKASGLKLTRVSKGCGDRDRQVLTTGRTVADASLSTNFLPAATHSMTRRSQTIENPHEARKPVMRNRRQDGDRSDRSLAETDRYGRACDAEKQK